MAENKVDIKVNDITTVCNKIVTDILSKMHREKVSTIKSDKSVREKPILYRWWFPADFVETLKNLEISDLEPKEISPGEFYYALYFGKSKDGLTRFKAHTSGNSTLRRTLDAICKDLTRRDIKNLINDCYFEWVEVDNESLLECLEAMCIVSGKYPLNIEGNPYCQDCIVKARKNIKV